LAEQIAQAQAKINEAIAEENELRAKSLSTFQGTLDKFNEEYKFRTSLISLTDDQREKEEQRFALQQKLATAILPIQTRILELEQLNTDASKARIKVLKDSIGDIQQVYETELGYLDKMVDARNTELRLKRESDSIDQAKLSAQEAILEVQERINRASEDASLGGLSGINRELKEIELNELRIARAAKARVTAQLEKGVDANVIAAELAKIDAITSQAIMRQQDLAKTAYENSRMFSTGWKKAFQEYEDNATNASKTAQRIFEKSTQGMEDAIVGFAKTGKFEWRGFVNSILEELLRSQVQQLIAKTFGGLGLGGGNSGGGGLFGGFFATGGMIPPGRFGVVGENGPELVSGPANVTPDLGGGNVTYNINAVDAMSFKQMVAQDPSFLFAVTEQGRRTLPQTRR
jgi:lambda family phage tail tape measure protein